MKKAYVSFAFVIFIGVVSVIFGLSSPALAVPSVSYETSFDGTNYTYYVTIDNTSSSTPYDVRGLLLGAQIGGSFVGSFQDITPLSAPLKWNFELLGPTGGMAIFWGADWDNNSAATSGYILAGTSLDGFLFASPMAPPGSVPFSVEFTPQLFPSSPLPPYNGVATYTGSINPVPEPSTMLLLGSGLVGLMGLKRKLKK